MEPQPTSSASTAPPNAAMADAAMAGADLAGAAMRQAQLGGFVLEGAKLCGADLSGADLSGVRAAQADFSGALMEDAVFTGAGLRHCRFDGAILEGANFAGADLWGATLDGAELRDAKLSVAILHEASLAGADLTGADLSGAELSKAKLRGATLHGADLRGCNLSRADLTDADLTGARLPRIDLTSCQLSGIRLHGAWLEGTRLAVEQLGDGLGEERAREYPEARLGYLALEQNFRTLGDPEASRWCYLRARRMGKRASWDSGRRALKARSLHLATVALTRWTGDAVAEWLCDYGESLPRVLRAFVVALAAFAVFYAVTGSLVHTGPTGAPVPSHDLLELLGFSFLNMCTSAVPDVGLKPASRIVLYVSSLQYVTGLVLIGLFGYVLGNRIRR